jgi:predicted ATP-grasp superfamily ATP-dependent carboligase
VYDALVIGLGATGLAVARALGRRGLRVAGCDKRPWEVAARSRYVERVPPDAASLAELPGSPAVFTAGDPELAWAIKNLHNISGLRVPGSYTDGSALAALDKRVQYERCLALGVPMPRTWINEPAERIGSQANFPVLVKPAMGGAGVRIGPSKLEVCQTAKDLAHLAESVDFREVVTQEWIEGADDQLAVCILNRRQNGDFGPVVTAQKERQWPKRVGSGARVVTTDDDTVRKASIELVERLGLGGICAVEWKRSNDRLVFIEVNPRPVLWGALADSVFIDSWADLTGRRPPVPVATGPTRWRYWLRDPAVPNRDERLALEAWDDPAPGLYGPAYSAALWLARKTGRR